MRKNRRDFIKATGILSAASLIPSGTTQARDQKPQSAGGSCTLVPTETAGPFPLDLTANTFYFRKDIREDRAGAQLNLRLRIIGAVNCEPMRNARVNIWHCDKDGFYSGYNNSMNPGQQGKTYLRHYQMTDANGEVEFTTIFPGWYPGRTCHIHFQVYVSSSYAAISQLTFEVGPKNEVYATHPTMYTKGADPRSPGSDNIFSDGYAYQLATLTTDTAENAYDSFLEVAVQGNGTVGIGHLEKENARQFTLGQNFPNPFSTETTIPLALTEPSDVILDIFDMMGKKVASMRFENQSPGNHLLNVNRAALAIAASNYLYQVEISNANGTFRDYKLMTAEKK
jgi:protocatechuate 3,4-dioxygenase beta subunit